MIAAILFIQLLYRIELGPEEIRVLTLPRIRRSSWNDISSFGAVRGYRSTVIVRYQLNNGRAYELPPYLFGDARLVAAFLDSWRKRHLTGATT